MSQPFLGGPGELLPISLVYFGSGRIKCYAHSVTPAARSPAPGRTAVRRWRSPAIGPSTGEDSLLSIMIAVTDTNPAGLTPDLGREKEKAQAGRREMLGPSRRFHCIVNREDARRLE